MSQNFCDAELGQPKALTLAARYGQAWGVEIRTIHARFAPDMLRTSAWHPAIVVGCVDNAPARQSIADTLVGATQVVAPYPRVWWLDCGNWFQSGQVLLGCTPEADDLRDSFRGPTLCAALPSPALQHPELLEAHPEGGGDTSGRPLLEDSRLSPRSSGALGCAEIAAGSAQSLVVNQRVAAEAADFLTRLAFGGLKRFATYFDLASGTAKSRYATPETVAEVTGLSVEALVALPERLTPRSVPR